MKITDTTTTIPAAEAILMANGHPPISLRARTGMTSRARPGVTCSFLTRITTGPRIAITWPRSTTYS